jgi:hypothetical protein
MPAAKGADDSCLARTNWIHAGFAESKRLGAPRHGVCDEGRAEQDGSVLWRNGRGGFGSFREIDFLFQKSLILERLAFAKRGESWGFS